MIYLPCLSWVVSLSFGQEYLVFVEVSLDGFRSLLFVPGNREDMLGKVGELPTDALVPDLEDSVPFPEKINAREIVSRVVKTLAQRGQAVIPRINSIDTGLAVDDMAAVVCGEVYGVSVGKVESPWDVTQLSSALDVLEKKSGLPVGHTKLFLWLESAKAVILAYEIAKASERIVAVGFGAEDYTNDMGVQRTETGEEVLFARSRVAVAARAADVLALDTPYVNFRDPEGLRRDAEQGLQLGFRGKFAIHPSQVEIINSTFSPSPEDVEHARRVVEAFEEAEARGSGATSLDGKMIDVPIVKRARYLLAMAESASLRD